MRILLFFSFFLLLLNAKGQTDISSFDRTPAFPGGEKALFNYIESHLEVPKKLKKEGLVYVQLTISEKGRITEKKILRSTDKKLESPALEALKNMPNWLPALKNGVPYEEKVIVPISFKTRNYSKTK